MQEIKITKTIKLPIGKELRIITDENFLFRIESGLCEWNGCELSKNTEYPVKPETWLVLFAIEESTITIENPKKYYISERSTIEEYYEKHTFLDLHRQNLEEDETAPVILITGPQASGKTTFALHLLNYATQTGYTPIYVDLSMTNNSITLPGCVACTVVSSPINPTNMFDDNMNHPLIYCCGSMKYDEKKALFSKYIQYLSEYCNEKIERDEDKEKILKKSGIVVKCPFYSMEVIKDCVSRFNVKMIYVMDSEELYNDIHNEFPEMGVSLMSKPYGLPLCLDYNNQLRKRQNQSIVSYLEGNNINQGLCPNRIPIDGREIKIITIDSLGENTHNLSFGETEFKNRIFIKEVELNYELHSKGNVFAVLNMDTLNGNLLKKDFNVVGFVIGKENEEFDKKKRENNLENLVETASRVFINFYLPNPNDKVPGKVFMEIGMELDQDN